MLTLLLEKANSLEDDDVDELVIDLMVEYEKILEIVEALEETVDGPLVKRLRVVLEQVVVVVLFFSFLNIHIYI
jgi:hypothetical protein